MTAANALYWLTHSPVTWMEWVSIILGTLAILMSLYTMLFQQRRGQ